MTIYSKAFKRMAEKLKKAFPKLPIVLLMDSLYASKTVMDICKENALKMEETGRLRWKIENEGFNRQKHWQGNIKNACSWNEMVLKNHYLMQQISDFMKQLYEYYVLKKLGIEKKQKNISSELLISFEQQLTAEDISNN